MVRKPGRYINTKKNNNIKTREADRRRTYAPSLGYCVMVDGSCVITGNSHDRESIESAFLRALVCNNAVRNPVG